jgi:hypothetical protein
MSVDISPLHFAARYPLQMSSDVDPSSAAAFVPFDFTSLSTPLQPPSAYHSLFWFTCSFVLWIVLHIYILPLYTRAADALHFLWRQLQKRRKKYHDAAAMSVFAETTWGARLQHAYRRLSKTKRAYMRRLLRSFIYYTLAILSGFYFLLRYCRTVGDLYLVYTPGMDVAFCFAASHFLWCCIEDFPCRVHMGKTKCEQQAVFGGYIIHHFVTAGAYLACIQSQQLGSMCLMGLTFEGPVFFACLREIVSLYDEDFDLFERVPAQLLRWNWTCAFVSLLPCRYVSVGIFFYSAINWRSYLQYVEPEMRLAYWYFGGTFFLINMYFTWLLTYWYGQDQRYLRKKKQKQQAALEKQQLQQQMRAEHPGMALLTPLPTPAPPHAYPRLNSDGLVQPASVQLVTYHA